MLDEHYISNTSSFTTSILSTNTVINASLLDTLATSNNTMTNTTTNNSITNLTTALAISDCNKTSTLRSTKSNKSSLSSSSSTTLSLKMNAFRKLINYDESISCTHTDNLFNPNTSRMYDFFYFLFRFFRCKKNIFFLNFHIHVF